MLIKKYNSEPNKYNKDCEDFQPLNDGTLTGEHRYCNLSLFCRQIDFLINSGPIGMEANYLTMIGRDGEEYHELFCTGMYDLRPHNERLEDNKVS